jgi:membrane-bound lytic murein transglycosylase D
MADRQRLLHWLTVALVSACVAGASLAAPRSPAADNQAEQSAASARKRARAERQAEERRAHEERAAQKAARKNGTTAAAPTQQAAPTAAPPETTTASAATGSSAGAVAASPSPEAAGSTAGAAPEAALDPNAVAADEDLAADLEAAPLEADLQASTPAPEDDPDAAKLLAESLATYESAHSLWEQGLVEEAFGALDAAYELMAAVDVERDPLHAQEKEDLRRLISRRVVEIYASRPTAAGDLEGSIPIEINEHVQREILSFSGPERQFFIDAYVRGGQFRPMILDELRAAGMPLELAWMPIVESGFKVRAYSVARALGLWQFIASTGYRFGLERSNWIDERMDPHKSTKAAIGYLTELHALFGDWLTALAAYNCGEHLVLRLLSSQPVSYFDHFWDLYLRLPRETRRYVPRFLAVLAILEDPAAYGFTLPEPQAPVEFDVVRTERTVDLGELESRLQLADGTIKGLNPELRRNATPADPYDVKVPRGMVDQVAATIPQLSQRVASVDAAPERSSATTHRVRPGETLSRVASRYGTTVDALVALNGLQSADRIWPGQTLRVKSGGSKSSGGSSGSRSSSSAGGNGGTTTHRVRQGDNLWLIAQRYGTTVERIKLDNGLRGNLLRVGQKLVIRSERG